MVMAYFTGILAFMALAIYGIFAEEAPKVTGVPVDISQKEIEHVNVDESEGGGTVIFALHDGYAVEKVLDGNEVIKTFDLDSQTPKYITKHVEDGKTYLVVVVEAAYHLAFKKENNKWVDVNIATFHEEVFFKEFETIVLDLEKFEDASLFTVDVFGSGKKYSFEAPNKRASNIVSGELLVVPGDDKVILDVSVYVCGGQKVATVWYIYKPDGRIKEIFFQCNDKVWRRVDTSTAAKTLNSFNSNFSADYKSVYDGFGVAGVFIAVATIAFSTIFR